MDSLPHKLKLILNVPKFLAPRRNCVGRPLQVPEVLQNIDAVWLFESAPDAMVLVDRHGRIALLNTHAEKMFGYGRKQLVGEPVEKLMPERFRKGHLDHRSRTV